MSFEMFVATYFLFGVFFGGPTNLIPTSYAVEIFKLQRKDIRSSSTIFGIINGAGFLGSSGAYLTLNTLIN